MFDDFDFELDSRWNENPFNNPSDCGLKIVDTLSFTDEEYEFSYLVVWKSLSDGKVYYASHSGCSCPTPFEDFHKLSDMTEIRNLDDLSAIKNWVRENECASPERKQDFMYAIRNALK